MRRSPAAVLITGLVIAVNAWGPCAGATPRRAAAVACAAPAAAEAGATILREGGNAVDAAVATALALAVVHPQAGNLGGGGFAVVRLGETIAALDFRETAPAAATHDMYLGADGRPVADRSLVGALAVGVPGSPAGLFELHRRFGALPWARVVAPAEKLARKGFAVTPRLAEEIAEEHDLLARVAPTAAVWLPGGRPPQVGRRLKLPGLAATLAAYAREGPQAITTGWRAAVIAASLRSQGGILTAADLAAYAPVWREPLRCTAGGWEVASMPLPSSGGLILAESIGMLERLRWATQPRGSEQRAHLLAEVLRRAYADRFLLGDPATAQAGPRELLDPAWLDRRTASIDRRAAGPSADVKPWTSRSEAPQTTHLSVIDGKGNAVALTTTLNGTFGCGILVPEVGFLLNNEMDDFAAAPGEPNFYGLVQGEANAVGPGKRMLSSMTPTVAWRGDEVLALGSPGGSHIPSTTLQVLLNVALDGDGIAAAVEHRRLHHQWQPDRLSYEKGALDEEALAGLSRRGHALREVRALGEVHAVQRAADGTVAAVADRRGPGAVAIVGRQR